MANPQPMIHQLQNNSVLGERLTTALFERRFYAEDMAPVPRMLVRPFFRTLPDAVARPRNAAEVAEAVRRAIAQRLAIIPRAAATTALFNVVPLRGGLVLDLNELVGVTGVDPVRQTVTVQSGTRWSALGRALQSLDLAVKSYPSSAVVSTVGGWFSTQGHGLGSLKFGPMLEQVIRAEVVLPNGQLKSVTPESDPPLAWFAAAEGTLGVVTEIELAVRPTPAASYHHLQMFDNLADIQTTIIDLARAEPRPYTLFFADKAYARMLARSGLAAPTSQPILLASYQGETAEVGRGKDRLVGLPGQALEAEFALEEWNSRLEHLRVKRGGPSLLAAELWLPLNQLAGYLAQVDALSRRSHTLIGNYGLVVSPDEAMVMSIYHCDARQVVDYTLALGLTAQLYRLGARYGGRPYGVGLWNTTYLAQIFSAQHLKELRRRKQALDPAGRFNPGKLYRAPFPLWPVLFKPGTGLLAAAHRWHRTRKNNHENCNE